MRSVNEPVRDTGGDVLVAARPKSLASYAAGQSYPFMSVAEPDRAVNTAFGLGRFGLSAMTRPGLLLTTVGLLASGG